MLCKSCHFEGRVLERVKKLIYRYHKSVCTIKQRRSCKGLFLLVKIGVVVDELAAQTGQDYKFYKGLEEAEEPGNVSLELFWTDAIEVVVIL